MMESSRTMLGQTIRRPGPGTRQPGRERLNLGPERLEHGMVRLAGAMMLSLLTKIGAPNWEILEQLTEVLQAHCQDHSLEDTLVEIKDNR